MRLIHKAIILIILTLASSHLSATERTPRSLDSWQEAIEHVLKAYRQTEQSKLLTDSSLNVLMTVLSDECSKIKSDTFILVITDSGNNLIVDLPQKIHITEVNLVSTTSGKTDILVYTPSQFSIPMSVQFIYRPLDLFLLYARRWNFPIPKFIRELILDQFPHKYPQAFRIIKSNEIFEIDHYELASN